MSDIVSPLLQWLNAHPHLSGLVTFIISAGESVAIIGTVVPGSIMMTALGMLAGAGVIPLWPTLFWAILGAIVGDGISYWLGYYFKDRLPQLWPFRKYPAILKTGEAFFYKYGSMSVFIGRFVGPVRALVPLVAGMLGMRPLQFTLANVTSAIGWAPIYMLPGILLGAASLELPPDIAIHVMLVLFLIILFIMLCLWFVYKLLKLISNRINQLQDNLWQYLKNAKHFSTITVLLKHHDPRHTHGQLNLAIYFLFAVIAFFVIAIYAKIIGPNNIMINDAVYHLFRGIRTDTADNLMIAFTLLGQKEVILPVILTLSVWFMVCRRFRTAFHTLALGICAAGSVFVFKHLFQSPRPWGILSNPETFSMPSGHTTLSTAIYMGLAFLMSRSVRPSRRRYVYACAIFLIFLIAVSRLYLGAHWFTDILCGVLLGMSVLIFVIISYEREREAPLSPRGILLITFFTLLITFNVYQQKNITKLEINYSQVEKPPIQLNMTEWWQTDNNLPAYRVSLFGFPSQELNLAWVGDLEQIRQTLLQEGWTKPPARDFISTLHRLADVQSTQYLPMVSPQYIDKRPALILTRSLNQGRGLLVLRLWNANRIIQETRSPLWVGIVGVVPRSYSWLYKKNHSHVDVAPVESVFFNKTAAAKWQWESIEIPRLSKKTRQITQQKMIVIRPK